MTLWAIARSPLILGANLTRLDPATLALLTNRTVIDIDQNGRDARQVNRDGSVVAWTSTGRTGKRYLALFNTADAPVEVRRDFAFYGLIGSYRVRDVWKNTAVDKQAVDATLGPHGTLLLELSH